MINEVDIPVGNVPLEGEKDTPRLRNPFRGLMQDAQNQHETMPRRRKVCLRPKGRHKVCPRLEDDIKSVLDGQRATQVDSGLVIK